MPTAQKKLIFIANVALAIGSFSAMAGVRRDPPKLPHISPDLTDEQLEKMKQPAPPVALQKTLEGLGEGSIDQRIAKLKAKVLADLVPMPAGSFMMGDFGKLWSPDDNYYTGEADNKPAHKVTLAAFSIARYKTTYAEYDVFTDATHQPKIASDGLAASLRHPLVPAGVNWIQAHDYCAWLGKITGKPFSLPTEAQWEYAARNAGKYFVFATDNGSLDLGRNIHSEKQLGTLYPFDQEGQSSTPYAVGLFPPSPLGLFDMNSDGREWTNDWYSADFYKKSPESDPKGPATGNEKVSRGWPNGDSLTAGINVWRSHAKPDLLEKNILSGKIEPGPAWEDTVRCAENAQ